MRLDSFRAALPEEPPPISGDPNHANMEYTWHVNNDHHTRRPSTSRRVDKRSIPRLPSSGTTTSGTTDTSRPSTSERRPSTSERVDGHHNSRPPTSGTAEEPSDEHTIIVTPRKSKILLQHRRDDSKVDSERPNTAKRKKV